MHDYASDDMAVDTLETTVDIVDYAMSAGEVLEVLQAKLFPLLIRE